MNIEETMRDLKKLHSDEKGVLSVYLDTQSNVRAQVAIFLKNEFKRIKENLQENGTEEQLDSFLKMSKQVEDELDNRKIEWQRSIAIFVSEESNFFVALYLQLEMESKIFFGNRPLLDQLEEIEERFPHTGVILVSRDAIIVYDLTMGGVEDTYLFELDVDTEDWRRYQGRSASSRIASSITEVDRFKNRVRESLNASKKEIAKDVNDLTRKLKWKETVLIGNPDQTKVLSENLDLTPKKIVHKNLQNISIKEIEAIVNELYN